MLGIVILVIRPVCKYVLLRGMPVQIDKIDKPIPVGILENAADRFEAIDFGVEDFIVRIESPV